MSAASRFCLFRFTPAYRKARPLSHPLASDSPFAVRRERTVAQPLRRLGFANEAVWPFLLMQTSNQLEPFAQARDLLLKMSSL